MKIIAERPDVDVLLDQINETHKRLRWLLSPASESELKLAIIARQNRPSLLIRLFRRDDGIALQDNRDFHMTMEDKTTYRTDLYCLVLEDMRYGNIWTQYREALRLEKESLPSADFAWFRLRFLIRRYLRLYRGNVDEIWGKVELNRVSR